MPRTSLLPLLLLVLAGCQREPDFDERYEAASEKIRTTAAEIDAQIEGKATPDPDEEER